MKTYKEIVDLFQTACDNHLAINSFAEGSIDKLDATSQNVAYPYAFLRPITSTGVVLSPNGISGTRSLTFEFYMLDVPYLTDSDATKIMSNCEQYVYDVISYFTLGPQQQSLLINLSNVTPLYEAFNDRAVGWVATLNVIDSYTLNYCNYPDL